MDLQIAGRRAAVAASSAGLGLAAARALAEEGVHVAICGRDSDRLAAAEASLAETSGGVAALAADVSTPEGATDFIGQATERLGGIDIVVPNAGGPPPGTFADTELDAYQAAIELNLLSTVAMCKASVPAMQAQGWGRVIAITSIGARQPIPTLMASVTARTGVTGFLKVLATEVARDGVTVNSVQPGVHETDRFAQLHPDDMKSLTGDVPAGTIGNPADCGSVIAFLASEQAKFITGAGLPIDGGASRSLL